MGLPHPAILPPPTPRARDSQPASLAPPVLTVRSRLAEALTANAPLPRRLDRRLAAVIRGAVGNPGSLIRAELAHGSAAMSDLPERSCIAFACAVEYFHVASLTLDDLPSMDDSLERRGQICSHLLHGEGHAILGALALITRAYALMAEVVAAAPRATQLRAHAFLERCLGANGLVNGQAQDLSSQFATPRTPATAVALGKTAPLIRLALGLPAILAERDSAEARNLNALSVYWGLLYQGVDDLIDVMLPPARSGKTSGRDARLSRPSILAERGRDGAKRYLRRLLRLADRRLVPLFNRNTAFCFLASFQEAFRRRLEEAARGFPAPVEACP